MRRSLLLIVCVLGACTSEGATDAGALIDGGGVEPGDAGSRLDGGPDEGDASARNDDGGAIDGGHAEDGGDAVDGGGAPTIDTALDCGRRGVVGGLADGTDMQRLDLDRAAFPQAVCNDGTAGFFYFRPYEGEANRNRWVIQLQGGGGCGNASACFQRWCSVETRFGMQQMSATESPDRGIVAQGILARRPVNPLAGFNHVFVRYCSSDSWAGTRGAVVTTGSHPVSGGDVTATLHFAGAHIVDAVLDTLRQDGVPAPTFTLDGGSDALPDLDEAEVVMLAGASAGGAGTIHNADRVGELLRSHNDGELEYRLLIDSIVAPSMQNYVFDDTDFCTMQGACSYEELWSFIHTTGSSAFRGMIEETSCAQAHASDGMLYLCDDTVHLVHHHVTTPMFVRMGQTDSLLSDNQIGRGFTIDGTTPLDLPIFARLVREELAALSDPANAEEGDDMDVAPAVFVPTCARHETISDGPSVYDVTIDVGDTPTTMFELMQAWNAGTTPAVAIAQSRDENTCP